jgi:hypothetical protein
MKFQSGHRSFRSIFHVRSKLANKIRLKSGLVFVAKQRVVTQERKFVVAVVGDAVDDDFLAGSVQREMVPLNQFAVNLLVTLIAGHVIGCLQNRQQLQRVQTSVSPPSFVVVEFLWRPDAPSRRLPININQVKAVSDNVVSDALCCLGNLALHFFVR